MDTLKSTSILALIIASNPYHIISIQASMPEPHASIHIIQIVKGPNYG